MIITRRLSRYFGLSFIGAFFAVFIGLMLLVAMIDFIEMLRRSGGMSTGTVAQISFLRVPFLTERILPFAILVSAMFSYLSLSRRLELVVARAAGLSAWQFMAPTIVLALLLGAAATALYNPLSADMREQSARLQADSIGRGRSMYETGTGFWIRQRSTEGQAIINAKSSREQGLDLGDVTVFRLDDSDRTLDRIDAKRAVLHNGFWRLEEARIMSEGAPPQDLDTYDLRTALTAAQVRENFATPETVPFWHLKSYISLAENSGLAAVGYRLQYYQLLLQPLYLAAMVLLAGAVSLRLFRAGGIQKMVISGLGVGFFLFILAKVTGDLSKAGLVSPITAAIAPPLVGGVTGLVALLYQEDG